MYIYHLDEQFATALGVGCCLTRCERYQYNNNIQEKCTTGAIAITTVASKSPDCGEIIHSCHTNFIATYHKNTTNYNITDYYITDFNITDYKSITDDKYILSSCEDLYLCRSTVDIVIEHY